MTKYSWQGIKAKIFAVTMLCCLGFAGNAAAEGAIQVDPLLETYQATSGVSGNVSSIGSDTLNNLMTYWSEKFKDFYPNVNIQIEGKGSSTAPPALISGTAQFGPMSRRMKDKEIDDFDAKFGYKPTKIRVAVDALAVFVNKDNPIEGLTMAQVDAIFSKSRKRGYPDDVATWGQLGLTGEWVSKPISLFGRNSASGTYGFFKETALKNGDYKDTVKEQPGSASVVQGVTEDVSAVGYSGVGYKTAGVKTVPLSAKTGSFADSTMENCLNGSYPLARYLFVYVNRAPGKPLDPIVREFLKFVLSKEGQEIVVKDGYFPLGADVAAEEMQLLL